MTATLAWLPLSPLRPWAMSESGIDRVRSVAAVMASPFEQAHGRRDGVLADQGGPVGKDFADRGPASRVTGDPRWPRRDQRGELLGEPLHSRLARIPHG